MARITKTAIALNSTSIVDRIAIRTTSVAGHLVNHAESIVHTAPLGYQAARAKHDLNARIESARQYAATL